MVEPGTRLGPYEIVELLGRGGMGEVYRARDPRLGRDVAIKVLAAEVSRDAGQLARFEREARVVAALSHPNICTLFDIGRAGGLDYLVMELVGGDTLARQIRTPGLPLERFYAIAIPLAEALAVAHSHGVVHRDLKPDNVMVTPEGGLKILDFGLAKRSLPALGADATAAETEARLTRAGRIVGTLPYMSPEQLRSLEIDEQSDIFALGVMLFELLAGSRPFAGDSVVDLISSILKEEPPALSGLRPDLPRALVELVRGCLEKERDKRVASAGDVAQRLVSIRSERGEAAERPDSAGRHTAATSAELDPRTVAVVPFETLGGSEEAELLAAGLHNDLITELCRIPGLTVISRGSMAAYANTDKAVPQIGHELGAGTLVAGTVQSAGQRVRMSAQLVEAASNVQRWAERYDRELTPDTLFSIQTELSRRIVDSLHERLAGEQAVPAGKRQTDDLEAYRLCSMGRAQFDRKTETGFLRAVEHFEQAVARDPEYVRAWVGLADSLALMEDYGYGDSEELLAKAKVAADRALQLDPDSAEAHTSLGLYYSSLQDGPSTLREYELALQIQPGYADAHNWTSWMCKLVGRPRRGLAAAERAVELDPLSAEAVSNLALALLTVESFKRGLNEARRTSELSPGYTTPMFYEGLALYELGRYEEAASQLLGLEVEWAGLGPAATLALAQLAAGDPAAARRTSEGIDPGVDLFAVGLVELALGEVDRAFDAFAHLQHLSRWPTLAVHYFYRDVWDSVRDDPRYRDLVRRTYTSWKLEPREEPARDRL